LSEHEASSLILQNMDDDVPGWAEVVTFFLIEIVM
jgi:hypothetical protein